VQFTSTENETARSVPISANNDLSTPSPDDPRYTLEVSQLKPLSTSRSFQQVGTPTGITFQPTADNLPTGTSFQQTADNFPTGITFQQVDTLPESHGVESEVIDSFVVRQAPDQESKNASPSGRTVSAQITFSKPVSPEEKQIDEKHQRGMEELDAPPSARTASVQNEFSEPVFPEERQLDEKHQEGVDEPTAPLDKAPSPETDGVGSDSPFRKATGVVIKQTV